MSTRHRHGSHNFLRACVLATVAAAAEGEKLSPSLSGLPRSIHSFFDNPPQPVTKKITLVAMCTIKGEKGTGSEKKKLKCCRGGIPGTDPEPKLKNINGPRSTCSPRAPSMLFLGLAGRGFGIPPGKHVKLAALKGSRCRNTFPRSIGEAITNPPSCFTSFGGDFES